MRQCTRPNSTMHVDIVNSDGHTWHCMSSECMLCVYGNVGVIRCMVGMLYVGCVLGYEGVQTNSHLARPIAEFPRMGSQKPWRL